MSIGTWLFTLVYGQFVGKDEFGNKYYRGKLKDGSHVGRADKERRWVVYKKVPEPTLVPPVWHEWLHYITDEIPLEEDQQKQYKWQKNHLPNLTGTKYAYRPKGSPINEGRRPSATGDYAPWQPDSKTNDAA